MIFPQIPLAQSIIQICLAKGLRDIVICPGSRNAPLTIGFANNPGFTCYSIADERCAAFFALGIAQQKKKPVAVVCTSGSALLNFYPAFAEAFYSQIPLVVISADRPKDKIDIGDGQTIRQQNVFENHSVYNANLTADASPENDLKINEAINASFLHQGPVHINAPFEEPLYETSSESVVDPAIKPVKNRARKLAPNDVIVYSNIWNTKSKKMILIGVNEPDELSSEILTRFAEDPSVVVFTETTSNILHSNFIGNIDRIITPCNDADFEELRPQILITLGGMVVSKRIKTFLRTFKPLHHWHIDPLRAYDTYGSLSKHFQVSPHEFFTQLLPFAKPLKSTYQQHVIKIRNDRAKKHDKFFQAAVFSDFKAYGVILPALPHGIQLHIGNSAAIRYAQLFDIDQSIKVFSNRGTSGIDGSTSTAIGAAIGSSRPAVIITGDISFFYDSNALWNSYIPKNFKIIVVNNGGGGIFRILPGHRENDVFNTFFETSHCLTAEHLARMYKFKYFTASDESTLTENLSAFLNENTQPAILEVFTPTRINDKVLADYFRQL